MYKFPYSLPDKSFEEVISIWFRSIQNHESASILNLSSSSQWHYVHQLLARPQLLQKHFPKTIGVQLIPLDLNSFPIDSIDEFDVYLKEMSRKNAKKTIIFVQGADYLLSEKLELLKYFNDLSRKKKVSFLLFFKKNITLPRIVKLFSSYDILYQNIIPIPLNSKKSIRHFILHEANRYKTELPMHLVDTIMHQCGGRMLLAKQAVRFYSRTQNEIKIFNHEEMRLKLRMIYEEFEPEEKEVLEKLVMNQNISAADEKDIVNYFTDIRLVVNNQHQYQLTIPLLETYLRNLQVNKWDIHLDKVNRVCVNGVIVSSIFSKREERLLVTFIAKKQTLISRETVATILWKEHESETYTDWALDMSIKRLREKLQLLGLNREIIKTKRKLGFIFG